MYYLSKTLFCKNRIEMRKVFGLVMAFVFALSVFSCNEKKLTEEDVKKTEAQLFNEDQSVNKDNVELMIETYCKFAEQNPDSEMAPEYLFRALEISMNFRESDQSLALGDKLIKRYPTFEKIPVALFMEATFVYEPNGDLGKAREIYEKIIKDYPDNEFVPSAEQAIENLGKTPEELIKEFEQMD
jgi:hypothetical protein